MIIKIELSEYNIAKETLKDIDYIEVYNEDFVILKLLEEVLICDFNFELIESKEDYILVNKAIFKEDKNVVINDITVGEDSPFTFIAGPCSVSNEESLLTIAKSVKNSGASILRAGAYKPRTSPYSFTGLKELGLDIINKVSSEVNINSVSEIMDTDLLALYDDKIDVLQIGARSMQNFSLLNKVGQSSKPVILKRGFANTIEEWILAAEYIVKAGNPNVILCERGIRTFEDKTRNTLDLSVISIIKELTNLPIIVDPSHATGNRKLVKTMSLAAYVAGADGLMLEVSDDPINEISDADQAISLDEFSEIVGTIRELSKVIKRDIYE